MLTADVPSLAEPRTAPTSSGCWGCRRRWRTFRDLAHRFGTLVRARTEEDALDRWLDEAAGGELGSFAAGLRQDEHTVRAALLLPWSSGQVEGQVTRLNWSSARAMGVPSSICSRRDCFVQPDGKLQRSCG